MTNTTELKVGLEDFPFLQIQFSHSKNIDREFMFSIVDERMLVLLHSFPVHYYYRYSWGLFASVMPSISGGAM